MEAPPSTADILLLLQRQNDNMYHTVNALTGNISESLKTINLLQQENTRPRLQDYPPQMVPLIDRIGERAPTEDHAVPVTFPSISSVPIIREHPEHIPLVERVTGWHNLMAPPDVPPPPHQPPTVELRSHTLIGGPDFQGEGVRRGQPSFAQGC